MIQKFPRYDFGQAGICVVLLDARGETRALNPPVSVLPRIEDYFPHIVLTSCIPDKTRKNRENTPSIILILDSTIITL